MPNTLGHFAVQGIANKTLYRRIDLKWVFLGCIIPDIPWIIQRATRVFLPEFDPYTLRSYAIVQASFLFCLFLCAAFAAIAQRPKFVLLILSANALLHLLLDACEIKLGSGVHLFAPFSWKLLSFGFIWPENLFITGLSFFGLIFISIYLFAFRKDHLVRLTLRPTTRITISAIFLIFYVLLPILFLNGPVASDNHSLQILKEKEHRVGKILYIDRRPYIRNNDGSAMVVTFADERIKLVGNIPSDSGLVSVKGRFVKADTIEVIELHQNSRWFRNLASYVGLFLLMLLWIKATFFPLHDKSSKT